MKETYKDIVVNRKYKLYDGFAVYEGTLVKECKSLFKRSSQAYTFKYNTNQLVVFCTNGQRIGTGEALCKEIEIKGLEVKYEGDCCLSPDLEKCGEYPVHDILYAHCLDRFEVIDYDFVGDFKLDINFNSYKCGFIKFKDTNYEYTYKVDVRDKISEYACLNCKTMDNSEEKKVVSEFNLWYYGEVDKRIRKKKVKEICKDSKEND